PHSPRGNQEHAGENKGHGQQDAQGQGPSVPVGVGSAVNDVAGGGEQKPKQFQAVVQGLEQNQQCRQDQQMAPGAYVQKDGPASPLHGPGQQVNQEHHEGGHKQHAREGTVQQTVKGQLKDVKTDVPAKE